MKTYWKISILLLYAIFCYKLIFKFDETQLQRYSRLFVSDDRENLDPTQNYKSDVNSLDNALKSGRLNSTSNTPPRIIFTKTHKAGSSTITLLLQRYGLNKNKTFAMPLFVPYYHIFSLSNLFTSNMTLGYREHGHNSSWKGFDLLVNHARLNPPEMDKVVKNAFYLTILRNPISQFPSAFKYFLIDSHVLSLSGVNNSKKDAIDIFFEKPRYYHKKLKYLKHFQQFLWNGQAFDLGLNPELFDDPDYVSGAIHRLMDKMDLFMLMEYFDESLILMKNALGLGFEDIVYVPVNARNKTQRVKIDPQLEQKIGSWNNVDMLLYTKANQTFWRNVKTYGESFYKDLDIFRELNANVKSECQRSSGYSSIFPSLSCVMFQVDERINGLIIREETKRKLNITEDLTDVSNL